MEVTELWKTDADRYRMLMAFLHNNYPDAWAEAVVLYGNPEAPAPQGVMVAPSAPPAALAHCGVVSIDSARETLSEVVVTVIGELAIRIRREARRSDGAITTVMEVEGEQPIYLHDRDCGRLAAALLAGAFAP